MRFSSFVVVASLLAIALGACSSSAFRAPVDLNGHDAGVISGECHATGSPNATCAPAAVACTPVTHPFGPQGRGSCTIFDLHEFYAACMQGTAATCAAYKANSDHAGCLTCLVHTESDREWGPVMEASNGLYSVNVANCDYGAPSTRCLEKKATLEACERAACAPSCGGTAGDPASQKAFTACLEAAKTDPASCAAYAEGDCRDSTACRSGKSFAGDFYAVAGDACVQTGYCAPMQSNVTSPAKGPSRALHQGACTLPQIDTYALACAGADGPSAVSCLQFATAAENADCYACIVTDETDYWGPLVSTNQQYPAFYNEAGCVGSAHAAANVPAGCEAAIQARISCEFAHCPCTGVIAPYDICSKIEDDSACAALVGPAKECESTLTAEGGDVAKCVARTEDYPTDVKALVTLFCAP